MNIDRIQAMLALPRGTSPPTLEELLVPAPASEYSPSEDAHFSEPDLVFRISTIRCSNFHIRVLAFAKDVIAAP
eukprot:GSChrysophyteH1.ASY1.ANO1.1406.1 assembled CDS